MRATRICRCVYDAWMDKKLEIAHERRMFWSRKPWRKIEAARRGFLEIHPAWKIELRQTSLLIKFMKEKLREEPDFDIRKLNEYVKEYTKKNVQRRKRLVF